MPVGLEAVADTNGPNAGAPDIDPPAGYVLDQWFRYEYPAPVRLLRHRLMVVPPRRHGDQRRVHHRLEVRGTAARVTASRDTFGNDRVEVSAPFVAEAVEFETWVTVERDDRPAPFRVSGAALADRRLRRPSRLTRPDAALADAAARLGRPGRHPMEVAEAIAAWTHGTIRYAHGSTTVRTTAAQALELGRGVCQDYAHVMLAVARGCGLTARYVSGHLVGEGGTHAWVEVIVADPHRAGAALVMALDPTHDRRVGPGYLTVAVGRDYADVAPTSGTFKAACAGQLSCRKRLQVVELVDAG